MFVHWGKNPLQLAEKAMEKICKVVLYIYIHDIEFGAGGSADGDIEKLAITWFVLLADARDDNQENFSFVANAIQVTVSRTVMGLW